jgi:hypothetical protein
MHHTSRCHATQFQLIAYVTQHVMAELPTDKRYVQNTTGSCARSWNCQPRHVRSRLKLDIVNLSGRANDFAESEHPTSDNYFDRVDWRH